MFKYKGSKVFLFFLFFYYSILNASAAETGAVSSSSNSIGNVPLDAGASNWEWVNLGSVSIPKYNESVGLDCNYQGSPFCAWSGMGIHHGRKLGNKPYFEFIYTTVSAVGDDGVTYRIPMSLAFPANIFFTIRHFSTHSPAPGFVTKTYGFSDAPKTHHTGWTGTPFQDWNTDPFPTCNNFGGGCNNKVMVYLSNHTPNPVLWAQIPKNLNAKKLRFGPVTLLKMRMLASESGLHVYSPDANLEISGEINLPQRCYISLSDSQITFNDVNPNTNNGLIQSKGITIKSTCYNAPSSSQFYVNVSSKNSTLNQAGNRIISAVDRDGKEAIGLIFSINKNPDCNNPDKFNSQYLVRGSLSGGRQEVYNDTINIGLCKYGIPAEFGPKNTTINITAKWVDLYT
ncbi:TPA: hypothetical protein L9K80_004873 [Klebsiella quasipneumoniae subsp. similipneumoniae]|nr:hypothetical protein [Klebsiella quasipneumoniae subsp. similipneumoniae]